jgi:hypothetical protein
MVAQKIRQHLPQPECFPADFSLLICCGEFNWSDK